MIEELKRAAAFADIRERLGKLVPRLASEHPGEVAATVAAIGRTLASAGLDFHDLARRIASPTSFDAMTSGAAPPRPAQDPEPTPHPDRSAPKSPTWSAETEAEYQAAQKPRRPPSPWPTWGRLSHFGRLEMLDTVIANAALTEAELDTLKAFHARYYREQIWPGSKTLRLFNAACRNLWERGWRPEGMAA